MSVFRSTSSFNKDDDDESDDDVNKGCDFLSSDDGSDDDLNKGCDFLSSITSDRDANDEILADLEERQPHSFHTVRTEYMKPHKPLVGVNFDPAWNKKIGPVENKAPLSRSVDDSPAEEIDSEEDAEENENHSPIPEDDCESEYDVSSDFESDTQSESPDEVSESPRPLDTNFSRTKLSSNIYIEYPNKYNHSVEGTKVVPWPQDRRAAELKDTTLRFAEKMCTDIYLMADKQNQGRVLQFSQTDEALVTFSVKAPEEGRAGVGYRYMARIKNKTHWVERVANCEGDEIKFHATEIESFYIIKIPEKETGVMKPEGNTLSFRGNRGVSLDIPSQAVDRTQPITMEVNNVDKVAMKLRHSLYPEKFKLQKISQRLIIEHEVAEFNKEISVKLDLETFRENADPLEPVAILWNEGEPTFKSQAECRLHREDKQLVMTMKNFPNKSGLSVGLVVPGKMNHEEAKLAYADVFMCKLTVHVRIIKPQVAMMYINCFMIENEPFVMNRYQSLCLIGSSEDFYLKNFQRIRVHLSGNSLRKKLPKQKVLNSFIVFSNQPKENCLSFVVEKNTRLGGCPNTILEFSLDSGSKRKIHRQEFDPWMLVGMSRDKSSAFKLSRGQTSTDFKSNQPL